MRGKAFAGCAVATLALLAAAGAAAQNQGVMRGQVRDFEGRPLPGATLIIRHARGVQQQEASGVILGEKGATGRTFEVTTDEEGRFAQSGLRTGVYWVTLRVRIEGQERDILTQEAFVQNNLETEVDYNLQKLMAAELAAARQQAEDLARFEEATWNYLTGLEALEESKRLQEELGRSSPEERARLEEQFRRQWQETVASLQAALAKITDLRDENLHLILARLGEAYFIAGRYSDAASHYQRALIVRPDKLPAAEVAGYYINLGNALARLGRLEEARGAYEKAAAAHPESAVRARVNQAIALYNARRVREAIALLEQLVEQHPEYPLAWYVLGSALLTQVQTRPEGGRMTYVVPPGTIEAYQKYLELEPQGRYATDARLMVYGLQAMITGDPLQARQKK